MSELEKKSKRDGAREQAVKLRAELEEATKTIAELRRLNATLEADKTRLEAECTTYRKSLYALTREEFSFTEQELAEMRKNGLSLDDLIRELEGTRAE